MASLSRIVSTPDLTEQVDQRLLHAICDGELVPDARLTQEELAVALGVSRPARAPGAAASARALWSAGYYMTAPSARHTCAYPLSARQGRQRRHDMAVPCTGNTRVHAVYGGRHLLHTPGCVGGKNTGQNKE